MRKYIYPAAFVWQGRGNFINYKNNYIDCLNCFRWPKGPKAQWPNGPMAQWPNGPMAQWPVVNVLSFFIFIKGFNFFVLFLDFNFLTLNKILKNIRNPP